MRNALALGFIALLVTTGCGQPPQADVDAAKSAIDAARQQGAVEYAPEAMKAAEDADAAMQAELDAQQGKFPLFRSYKVAGEKAAAAKQAGEQAQASAQQGKELAKQQATAAIQEGQTWLTETQAMLAKAPRGKGSAADLAALNTDLEGASASLNEAQTLLTSENYKEALAKAEAAKASINGVKTQIEGAQAKVAGK